MCKNRKAIMTVWDLKGAVKFEYENHTYYGQVIETKDKIFGIIVYKEIEKSRVMRKIQRMENHEKIEFKLKTNDYTLCIIESIENLLKLSEKSFKEALINKCIEYLQEPNKISNYEMNYTRRVLKVGGE